MFLVKTKASGLPLYCFYDCTINLLPDPTPPCNRVYHLSVTEQRAMEEYVQETLQAVYLPRQLMTGSYLCRRENHVLITSGLNQMTIKYPYHLLLVFLPLKQGDLPRFLPDSTYAVHITMVHQISR